MRLGTISSFVAFTWIIVSAVSLLVGCGSPKTSDSVRAHPAPSQQLRLEIPQTSWVPIFFKEIDQLATIGNLPSLRTIVLPNDDLEARLWVAGGNFGMDGIVVRKTSGSWSGTYLHGFSKEPNFKKYAEPLQAPRSGWDTTWQRLAEAGLLTMPDASQVQCNVNGKDGVGFVFETNVNGTYRTYFYDNPAFAECDEAKQLLNIISIIDREFGLQWPTN